MKYQTSDDMTFEMALDRLSSFCGQGLEPMKLARMAQAIGLAYGMAGEDVWLCACSDAAIAHATPLDTIMMLSAYPEWCRGEGATYGDL